MIIGRYDKHVMMMMIIMIRMMMMMMMIMIIIRMIMMMMSWMYLPVTLVQSDRLQAREGIVTCYFVE